jgi:DNA-binding PadR family transcriptional regulator
VSQKPKGIYLVPDLVDCKAFLELPGSALQVYLLFLRRRVLKKVGSRGKERWLIENNGKIVFTYTEAHKKFGFTKPRFQRALDGLVEKGFIDITYIGGGVKGDSSTYAISERWRDYGTEKFDFRTRPRDTRELGFTSNNWEERTGKKRTNKAKSGNESINGSGNKSVTAPTNINKCQVTKTYP